jgi:hypothetical protein
MEPAATEHKHKLPHQHQLQQHQPQVVHTPERGNNVPAPTDDDSASYRPAGSKWLQDDHSALLNVWVDGACPGNGMQGVDVGGAGTWCCIWHLKCALNFHAPSSSFDKPVFPSSLPISFSC